MMLDAKIPEAPIEPIVQPVVRPPPIAVVEATPEPPPVLIALAKVPSATFLPQERTEPTQRSNRSADAATAREPSRPRIELAAIAPEPAPAAVRTVNPAIELAYWQSIEDTVSGFIPLRWIYSLAPR